MLRGGFIGTCRGGALFRLNRIADCAIFRIVGRGRCRPIAISFDEVPVIVIAGFQLAFGRRVAGRDRCFRSTAAGRFVNVLLVCQHGWRLFLSFRGNCRGSIEAVFDRPGFDLFGFYRADHRTGPACRCRDALPLPRPPLAVASDGAAVSSGSGSSTTTSR